MPKLPNISIPVDGMLYFKLETEALRVGVPVEILLEQILKHWLIWRERQQPKYHKGPPEGKFNR